MAPSGRLGCTKAADPNRAEEQEAEVAKPRGRFGGQGPCLCTSRSIPVPRCRTKEIARLQWGPGRGRTLHPGGGAVRLSAWPGAHRVPARTRIPRPRPPPSSTATQGAGGARGEPGAGREQPGARGAPPAGTCDAARAARGADSPHPAAGARPQPRVQALRRAPQPSRLAALRPRRPRVAHPAPHETLRRALTGLGSSGASAFPPGGHGASGPVSPAAAPRSTAQKMDAGGSALPGPARPRRGAGDASRPGRGGLEPPGPRAAGQGEPAPSRTRPGRATHGGPWSPRPEAERRGRPHPPTLGP